MVSTAPQPLVFCAAHCAVRSNSSSFFFWIFVSFLCTLLVELRVRAAISCDVIGDVALLMCVQASKGLESALVKQRRKSGTNSSFSSPQYAPALLLLYPHQAVRHSTALQSFVHRDTTRKAG